MAFHRTAVLKRTFPPEQFASNDDKPIHVVGKRTEVDRKRIPSPDLHPHSRRKLNHHVTEQSSACRLGVGGHLPDPHPAVTTDEALTHDAVQSHVKRDVRSIRSATEAAYKITVPSGAGGQFFDPALTDTTDDNINQDLFNAFVEAFDAGIRNDKPAVNLSPHQPFPGDDDDAASTQLNFVSHASAPKRPRSHYSIT